MTFLSSYLKSATSKTPRYKFRANNTKKFQNYNKVARFGRAGGNRLNDARADQSQSGVPEQNPFVFSPLSTYGTHIFID